MDWDWILPALVGLPIGALWNVPWIRPGWLLLGGLAMTTGVASVNWIAITVGAVSLFLAFLPKASAGRMGDEPVDCLLPASREGSGACG